MAHPPQEQTPSKSSHYQKEEQQAQYPDSGGSKDQSESVDSEALLQGFPPRDGEDPVQQELLRRLGEEKPEEGGQASQAQQ